MTVHFVLPGYAPDPVGGYRVVYEYADYLQRARGERVVLHHPATLVLRHGFKFSIRGAAGILLRYLRTWVDRPQRHGVRWFPATRNIATTFSLGSPPIRVSPDDIVIATAAPTAPFVSRVTAKKGVGVHFVQHVEDWASREEFLESVWALPLFRIVIAPWLEELAVAHGQGAALVLNAVDSASFPAGAPIIERPRQVLSMISPLEFKRPDLVAEVFTRLHAADPDLDLVAFGVKPRPSILPPVVKYHHRPDRELLASLYRSSRIYFCASDAEGWHLPPAEALLSGAAVVSTDIPGVRVVAGEAAEYVPPGDGEELCRAIIRLLSDLNRAQEQASAGGRALRARSFERAAESFAEALQVARDRRGGTL